jgi:organic radical activating enzyme
VPLLVDDDLDFSQITFDELHNARTSLYEGINDGTRKECDGCKYLMEKDESDICVGPVENVILHPYTTCNLRCSYCYFTDKELGAAFDQHKAHIVPVLENFYNSGILKKNFFSLSLGGGEPAFVRDLKETLDFLSSKWEHSSFVLISNSSIKQKVPYVIESLNSTPNVTKTLITSIDCGTRETYKRMRGRDLFIDSVENIQTYATSGVFADITLKYILLEDGTNDSPDDVFGFARFVKDIAEKNPHTTSVVIDADVKVTKSASDTYFKTSIDPDNVDVFTYKPITDDMLVAAGKLYYAIHTLLGVEVKFAGGRLSDRSDVGTRDVGRIKEYAEQYHSSRKPAKERHFLKAIKPVPGLKTIFLRKLKSLVKRLIRRKSP